MNSLIKQLHEKHPHLNDNQFKAEYIANLFPNRYAFNKYITNVWEGKILNDYELKLRRHGLNKTIKFLSLRLSILLEQSSLENKDRLIKLLKAVVDGKQEEV
jgi:hypothetical protein